MITIILIILFLIIAAISDAAMDIIQFKFHSSIFSKSINFWYWFNPEESWRNKYKNRDPKQGPAFFGSTTFLCWLTDAWHFFQIIMISCFTICIILALNNLILLNCNKLNILIIDVILFVIIKILYGTCFELFWNKIFVKK